MSTTAAVVTIGDELLSGKIENTNATWIASRLTGRGVEVRHIRVVPDEVAEISAAISELSQKCTFVLTTGGLGSTPDDVTLAGVAKAIDRPLEPHPEARRRIKETIAAKRVERPDYTYDIDAACQYPVDARIIANSEGNAPGCVCGNIYVLPGIPDEMKVMFNRVRDEFDGEMKERILFSNETESRLNSVLQEVREQFEVRVGCYPSRDYKRIRLASPDETSLHTAYEWLAAQSQIDSEPS